MVNQNLKAGDVCLITGAVFCHENIGKTCTLLRIGKPNEAITLPNGFKVRVDNKTDVWVVEGESLILAVNYGSGYTKKKKLGFAFPTSKNLMKIDGHKEPEANSEKLKQKA